MDALGIIENLEDYDEDSHVTDELYKHKCVKDLIAYIKNNKDNPEAVEKALVALSKMASNDAVIDEIMKHGGIDLIDLLMKAGVNLANLLSALAYLVGKMSENKKC